MASELPDQDGYFSPHSAPTTLAIVPTYELSETALKLSQVIEREAQRRSALRSGSLFRVEQNFPLFPRVGSQLPASFGANSSRRRSVTSVAPAPADHDRSVPSTPPRSALLSAKLTPINAASSASPPSPRASVKSRWMSVSAGGGRPESEASEANGPDEPLSWRGRVWEFFDDPQSSAGAYYFSVSLFFFITVSTVVFIAQTEKSLEPHRALLDTLEAVCAGVFTVEYTLRAIASPSKWSFAKNFGNWIDVAAILPFYLEAIMQVENAGSFGAIRIVRLTRVARVLKMSRYSSAIQVFVQAIAISIKALSMLVFLMAIAVVVFSSAIYFAEYTPDGCRHGGWLGNCDDAASDFAIAGSVGEAAVAGAIANSTRCVCVDPNPYYSIAASFWWSIVTMSTVGYGDMTPVTVPGRVVGIATILTGMLVLALPITVIGTNFQKVMKSVMHQTMKSNVDYLKGKKQICRQEIQAILQRFHAVTTDIHLDIDDIIRVYDTDNSGTLEDDELARFRRDLEMLQNRAFHNQHMDLGSTATAVAVATTTPLVRGGNRALGSMFRKLPARRLSVALPARGAAGPHISGRITSVSPVNNESRHSRKKLADGGAVETVDSPAQSPTSRSSSPIPQRRAASVLPVQSSKSVPKNLVLQHTPAVMDARDSRVGAQKSLDIQHDQRTGTIHITSSAEASSPVKAAFDRRTSGPSVDELVGDEIEKMLLSPPSATVMSIQMRSEPPSESEARSPHRSSHGTNSHHHSESHHSHHASVSHGHGHGYSHHSRHDHRAHRADEDLILRRLAEMQRSFEARLIETEARLDSKLLHLTKLVMRVQSLVDLNGD